MFLGPMAVLSGYCFITHWPYRWGTSKTDLAALASAIAASMGFLGCLPVPRSKRVLLVILSIPLAVVFCFYLHLCILGLFCNEYL